MTRPKKRLLVAGIAAGILLLLVLAYNLLLSPFAIRTFWLPMVIAYLMIYPALEKSFNIESTIKKMREEQLDAANEEDSRM